MHNFSRTYFAKHVVHASMCIRTLRIAFERFKCTIEFFGLNDFVAKEKGYPTDFFGTLSDKLV